MTKLNKAIVVLAAIALTATAAAQSAGDDAEELKIAALEALISAPPGRALPLATKAIQGNHSDEVKKRALFVLSQIDAPEARQQLLAIARQGDGDLPLEAIRMIGIGGDADALGDLRSLYADGSASVREAVLEAYLIADDAATVYELAANAKSPEEFEAAVEILGAMGAKDELRQLRNRTDMFETLVEAYAVAGDAETLVELASDTSDPERQAQAIEALGIIGGAAVNDALVAAYRDAQSDEIRSAALDGLLISGHDAGVLELYRTSDSPSEKRELLEYLVVMGSDEVWDLIDATFDGSQ